MLKDFPQHQQQQQQQQQHQQQQRQHHRKLHPLELFEILYFLASYLQNDIRTLSVCSRVCKIWYGAFNPQLWRILHCARLLPLGHLTRRAIDRNVHLVHQIRIGRIDPERYGMLESCCNLRKLQLEDERVSERDLTGVATTMAISVAGKKAKKVGTNLRDSRRHSVPTVNDMIVDNTDTSSSSLSSLSSPSSSGPSLEAANYEAEEGFEYDGDDEDDSYSRERWAELLIALIKRNALLQKISIMMERFEPSTSLWESIKKAGARKDGEFKSLECVFTQITTPQLVVSFLDSIINLEVLVLQHCTFEGRPPFPSSSISASILADRHYPRLKSLTLLTNAGMDLSVQLLFIQCFPNLESLSWSIMGSHTFHIQELCALFHTHCPKISSLVFSHRDLESSDLAQILHAIPRLVRLLLRFDAHVSMFNSSEVMDAMRRHFGTLKDLEFGQVKSSIRCGTVLEFLRGCPNLERLVAYGRLNCSRQGMMSFNENTLTSTPVHQQQQQQQQSEDHQVYGSENEPNTLKDVPWVCLGLKTLHVIMTGDLQNVWLNRSLQHRLFNQLGRLSHLQTLSLGHCILWMYETGYSHHGLDFTLEAGLAQLKGLRKLEELNIEGISQRMKEEDVGWMLENWPRLRVIEGELNYKREERLKLDAILEQKGFKILNHSYCK